MYRENKKRVTVWRFVFAAVTALVLCAVCVGGVSGAEIYVYASHNLADVVNDAEDGDVIVIMEDYTISEQVILGSEKNITITNAPGVNVKISSGFGELPSGANVDVDPFTLFKINAGKLIVKSNEGGGSITITTNKNGRAFDVNFDDRRTNSGDAQPATLLIEGNVSITDCGFADEETAKANDGGAVYVRSAGTFIMNESCSLYDNQAGAGGAVYVYQGKTIYFFFLLIDELAPGKFIMNGGSITGNYAINTDEGHSTWGGGVWVHENADFEWNGGEITGNGASGVPPDTDEADNYHNVYPYYNPPTTPEDPEDPDQPIYYPIYVVAGTDVYDGYDTVREAYEDAVNNKSKTTFTICLREDHEQNYKSVVQDDITATVLDAVTVGAGIHVTLQPAADSVTLTLRDQMFAVSSGGSLRIANNNTATLTVSGAASKGSANGGFISVNGGSLTLQNVDISSVKGKNGGAIYLTNSGTCTLTSGSITDCTASGNGTAVYVESGTLTVDDDFTLPDSNDVYLADNQVITITNDYAGTIGKITLSDYLEGRNVVDITQKTTVSSENFVLNPADADKYESMTLMKVSVENGAKTYLALGVVCQFTIIIPEDLELSNTTYDGVMTVVAENVTLPQNAWLSVDVSSRNDFNLILVADDSIRLPYALTLDDNTLVTSENAEIANFTTSGSVDMTARVTANPQYSGSYADALTFTVQYGTA